VRERMDHDVWRRRSHLGGVAKEEESVARAPWQVGAHQAFNMCRLRCGGVGDLHKPQVGCVIPRIEAPLQAALFHRLATCCSHLGHAWSVVGCCMVILCLGGGATEPKASRVRTSQEWGIEMSGCRNEKHLVVCLLACLIHAIFLSSPTISFPFLLFVLFLMLRSVTSYTLWVP
jgi:hypothetical protein